MSSCPVCFEDYDGVNVRPMVIPRCGHGLCQNCYHKLPNKTKCIVCRGRVDTPTPASLSRAGRSDSMPVVEASIFGSAAPPRAREDTAAEDEDATQPSAAPAAPLNASNSSRRQLRRNPRVVVNPGWEWEDNPAAGSSADFPSLREANPTATTTSGLSRAGRGGLFDVDSSRPGPSADIDRGDYDHYNIPGVGRTRHQLESRWFNERGDRVPLRRVPRGPAAPMSARRAEETEPSTVDGGGIQINRQFEAYLQEQRQKKLAGAGATTGANGNNSKKSSKSSASATTNSAGGGPPQGGIRNSSATSSSKVASDQDQSSSSSLESQEKLHQVTEAIRKRLCDVEDTAMFTALEMDVLSNLLSTNAPPLQWTAQQWRAVEKFTSFLVMEQGKCGVFWKDESTEMKELAELPPAVSLATVDGPEQQHKSKSLLFQMFGTAPAAAAASSTGTAVVTHCATADASALPAPASASSVLVADQQQNASSMANGNYPALEREQIQMQSASADASVSPQTVPHVPINVDGDVVPSSQEPSAAQQDQEASRRSGNAPAPATNTDERGLMEGEQERGDPAHGASLSAATSANVLGANNAPVVPARTDIESRVQTLLRLAEEDRAAGREDMYNARLRRLDELLDASNPEQVRGDLVARRRERALERERERRARTVIRPGTDDLLTQVMQSRVLNRPGDGGRMAPRLPPREQPLHDADHAHVAIAPYPNQGTSGTAAAGGPPNTIGQSAGRGSVFALDRPVPPRLHRREGWTHQASSPHEIPFNPVNRVRTPPGLDPSPGASAAPLSQNHENATALPGPPPPPGGFVASAARNIEPQLHLQEAQQVQNAPGLFTGFPPALANGGVIDSTSAAVTGAAPGDFAQEPAPPGEAHTAANATATGASQEQAQIDVDALPGCNQNAVHHHRDQQIRDTVARGLAFSNSVVTSDRPRALVQARAIREQQNAPTFSNPVASSSASNVAVIGAETSAATDVGGPPVVGGSGPTSGLNENGNHSGIDHTADNNHLSNDAGLTPMITMVPSYAPPAPQEISPPRQQPAASMPEDPPCGPEARQQPHDWRPRVVNLSPTTGTASAPMPIPFASNNYSHNYAPGGINNQQPNDVYFGGGPMAMPFSSPDFYPNGASRRPQVFILSPRGTVHQRTAPQSQNFWWTGVGATAPAAPAFAPPVGSHEPDEAFPFFR
ncbi:unnamed protein product [Amoebophrya sp. A120]|nr:unnamed protein product [Amoebophrya sp. A120]|eukprot:GSA120T00010755001.1